MKASTRACVQDLALVHAKAVYRAAVDARASDSEGEAWWSDVHAELREVVAARTAGEAAKVIAWWHHDWQLVDDTPKAVALRIRAAARAARQAVVCECV